MLHEQSSATGMMLTAVVEELMGGLRKLRIKREQEVEEPVAAFKQSCEELKKELEDFAARRVETVATQIVVCNFLLLLPPCLLGFAACGILNYPEYVRRLLSTPL